jgi:hypothetical protein
MDFGKAVWEEQIPIKLLCLLESHKKTSRRNLSAHGARSTNPVHKSLCWSGLSGWFFADAPVYPGEKRQESQIDNANASRVR